MPLGTIAGNLSSSENPSTTKRKNSCICRENFNPNPDGLVANITDFKNTKLL
jgi:hypothetical protein